MNSEYSASEWLHNKAKSLKKCLWFHLPSSFFGKFNNNDNKTKNFNWVVEQQFASIRSMETAQYVDLVSWDELGWVGTSWDELETKEIAEFWH